MASVHTQAFSAKDVAAHDTRQDCWMIIQGDVYDVTKYISDHPGGADILIEAAGKDATVDFINAGHSEDAFEIMAEYRVGSFSGTPRRDAPKPVTLQTKAPAPKASSASSLASRVVLATSTLAAGSVAVHQASRHVTPEMLALIPKLQLRRSGAGVGFLEGFLLASALFTVAGTLAANKFSKLLHFDEGGFMSYAPHKKLPKVVRANPLLQRGWLDPSTYHPLPLTEKILIAPGVYRLVFALPTPTTVLGLPIGQHVAIKADIDGKAVSRSYTPVSNNSDLGVLELVVRCYADGQLTGRYLSSLEVGDEVLFRGPKGAMRYQPGLCARIGMLAGGTGITPMYQVIRAICEDDADLTHVSLVYANRSEEDILLRAELDMLARRYPLNLEVHYLLDSPPQEWKYGVGRFTKELIQEKFPAPGEDTKVMLCGPPGMIGAAKSVLGELGFEKPGASAKMSDQVFCF